MTRTTRKQREALKRIYDRAPIFHEEIVNHVSLKVRSTYRQFRRLVQPTFGCDGAVVAPWCGMWLCIETDGYTHS
jgi:hypothetical protein